MNRKISCQLIFWVFLLMTTQVNAQECIHSNLSHKFDYYITAKKSLSSDSIFSSGIVTLSIYLKNTKKLIQKIKVINDSGSLYAAYENCKNVRSYITGYHENQEASDYDYGDLIVADLNFDGKEDFAIKSEYSVDAGPSYIFYFQDNVGHFHRSRFLTEHLGSFPTYVNAKQKTLVKVYVMGHYEGTKTFKYNPKNKTWRLKKWTEVDLLKS